MYQPDRGNYNKKPTVGHAILHSCLGKLVVLAAIAALLLFIAYLTVPSKETMFEEMYDNIAQCISENDSIKTDGIDAAINNIGYTFTNVDSAKVNEDMITNFNKYNKLEYYRHTFFATTLIHNNFRPDGTRVGVGIFGIVIPTVNFNDFLLRDGPMHKGYNQKLIRQSNENTEYYGDNPDLEMY
jgi:hypothetical protein